MAWLNILEIIARVISGVVVIGFILGMLLRKKYDAFENIAIYSAFIGILVGLGKLLFYAVFGG